MKEPLPTYQMGIFLNFWSFEDPVIAMSHRQFPTFVTKFIQSPDSRRIIIIEISHPVLPFLYFHSFAFIEKLVARRGVEPTLSRMKT